MASVNLSKEWIAFVASLADAPKNLLKSIFTALIAQLTTMLLILNINSLRQQVTLQIQMIIVGIAQSGLNAVKSVVAPVTSIFGSLPKAQTSDHTKIPTKIPEIVNNTQSLMAVINKPIAKLEDEINKLNKMKLYQAANDGKKNKLMAQIDMLTEQIKTL